MRRSFFLRMLLANRNRKYRNCDKPRKRDRPEKLLATEGTENTEGTKNKIQVKLFSAFLCALCELCGNYFSRFEKNFIFT